MTDDQWIEIKTQLSHAYGMGIAEFFKRQPDAEGTEQMWRKRLDRLEYDDVIEVIEEMIDNLELRPKAYAAIPAIIAQECKAKHTAGGVSFQEVDCPLCNGFGYASIFTPEAHKCAKEGRWHDCRHVSCSIICSCQAGDQRLVREKTRRWRFDPNKHVAYGCGSEADVQALCDFLGVESSWVHPDIRPGRRKEPMSMPQSFIAPTLPDIPETAPESVSEPPESDFEPRDIPIQSPRREIL